MGMKTNGPRGTPPVPVRPRADPPPDPKLASTRPHALRLKALGIDGAERVGPASVGKSKILDVLGKDRFAELTAVQVPGRVVWVNFELAREMGFEVPSSNQMTPELEKQLLDALCFRALDPGEAPGDRTTTTMYADRYGGTNLGANLGAGRAAFLPFGNLNIKGVGKTPLTVYNPNDVQHSHGGAPMREGVVEALWGEVNSNLFTHGSTRILTIIDHGDATEWGDGGREKRSLIVRAGTQFRPAHMLKPGSGGGDFSAPIFIRAAAETGELITRAGGDGEPVPDLAATALEIIDRHARTAAEQFRWRVLHGALSTSNMELGGAQLDLATQTTQPRTAPVRILDFLGEGGTFGTEHKLRATQIQSTYDGVRGSLSGGERDRLHATPLDLRGEMTKRYESHLGLQMIRAAGWKPEVADALAQADPMLVRRFSEAVTTMASLAVGGAKNVSRDSPDGVAVLDVFEALRRLPADWFADPSADLTARARELLQPVITGSDAQQAKLRIEVDRAIKAFVPLYGEVMGRASSVASAWYDGPEGMALSVTKRAAFENAPMDKLFRWGFRHELNRAVDAYDRSGDISGFREAIDKTVGASVRNVEALLGQGRARRLPDGGIELGARTIEGIEYGVRAWEGGKRRLHLAIEVQGDRHRGYTLSGVNGAPHLSADAVGNLRYRFTTDGWANWQEVPARLDTDDAGRRVVTFDIPVLGADVGQLEGLFHSRANQEFWLKDGASNFRGYAFAAPDDADLRAIAANLS